VKTELAEVSRFYVHVRGEPRDSCHPVAGAAGFEEAAVLYAEKWAPDVDADGGLSVIVLDPETGERQCFRLDLETGDAEPCA